MSAYLNSYEIGCSYPGDISVSESVASDANLQQSARDVREPSVSSGQDVRSPRLAFRLRLAMTA